MLPGGEAREERRNGELRHLSRWKVIEIGNVRGGEEMSIESGWKEGERKEGRR